MLDKGFLVVKDRGVNVVTKDRQVLGFEVFVGVFKPEAVAIKAALLLFLL